MMDEYDKTASSRRFMTNTNTSWNSTRWRRGVPVLEQPLRAPKDCPVHSSHQFQSLSWAPRMWKPSVSLEEADTIAALHRLRFCYRPSLRCQWQLNLGWIQQEVLRGKNRRNADLGPRAQQAFGVGASRVYVLVLAGWLER